MEKVLYVPVRIDPFGGLTDLQKFREKIGCDLVNIAIDVFDEKGNKKGITFKVKEIKEKSIQLFINGNLADSISSLSPIYQYELPSLAEPAKLFRSLLFNLYSRSSVRNRLLEEDLFIKIPYGLKIKVVNTIPVSSGLGTSGAFCAGLFEVLYKYFVSHGFIKPFREHKELGWKIIYESEVLLSKLEAGFQDQVAALYGGITHLYSDPDVSGNHVFRERLEIKRSVFSKNLQEKAALIYVPRTKTSAQTLNKIKTIAKSKKKKFYQFLTQAKRKQGQFYKFLVSANQDSEKLYLKFAQTVKDCWELQFRVLSEITSPLARFISRQDFPLLAFRECGAGSGGCILLLSPTNKSRKNMKAIFSQCKKFQTDISLFQFSLNNEGLTYLKN